MADSEAVKRCKARYREKNRKKLRAAYREYFAKNRDEISRRESEYKRLHPDRIRATQQRSQAKNAAKHKAYLDRYRAEHRDELRAKAREYREKNREIIRERNKQWAREDRKNNPNKKHKRSREVILNQTRNRRARKIGAEGKYTTKDVNALFKAQGGKCATCKTHIRHAGELKFEIDHVVPLSRGGSNWPSNLALSCKRCNRAKRDLMPEDWAAKNGLLFI